MYTKRRIRYLLIGLLLFNLGCFEALPIVLTNNKITADDFIEGLWESDNDDIAVLLFEKINDYEVLIRAVGAEDEAVFTAHKFGEHYFWSFDFGDDSDIQYFTLKVGLIDEDNFIVYDILFSEESYKTDFQNTPETLKETVFEFYLDQNRFEFEELGKFSRK